MTTDRFAPRSAADIGRLVLEHPLAWVTSGSGDDARATPLPIRPILSPDGGVQQLIGHFARSNPQVEALRRDPRASILFMGPHGYISPSWMSDRAQAPTWNYVTGQFIVDITFIEDDQGVEALLHDLVGAMEADRPAAWSIAEMGARYKSLSGRIIGFTGTIREQRVKFKLGQDERDDVFADIMAGLEREGERDLRAWMNAHGRPLV